MSEFTTPPDKFVDKGEVVSVPTKSPLASTAVWGLVVIVVARLAAKYLPDDLRQPAVDAALEILSWAVGPLMVLYGRWTAAQPLALAADRTHTLIKCLAPLAIVTMLAGCANLGVPSAQQIPADWVRADRDTYNAVAPEYQAYVNADPDKSPADREDTFNTLSTWDRRLDAREKSLNLPGGEEPLPTPATDTTRARSRRRTP